LLLVCQQIVAVDASPEMLEINRNKLDRPTVVYREADLFTWEPSDAYDLDDLKGRLERIGFDVDIHLIDEIFYFRSARNVRS
jgi:hypothetical protein